ncbi:hypothetical protein M434DRAFT_398484 [Hypoxylon sp. CO27-5]|nr:hypothetical protein M434DRAFT_398484 [Hypoxylon sp. CO27-5]
MEVLGTVAAAGQLIGTAVRILDSIAQLRDFLRHAPARYQGWHSELTVLNDTISYIRHNPALQTSQISHIVEAMAPKIETLTDLCLRHTPGPKQKLVSRLNRALSARTVESRILQSFQSLEHEKTTLILTISTLNVPSAIGSSAQTSQAIIEDETHGMKDVDARLSCADIGSTQHSLGLGGDINNITSFQELEYLLEQDNPSYSAGSASSTKSIQRYDKNQITNPDQASALIQRLLPNHMSSQSSYTVGGAGGLPLQTMNGQRSTFKNINLKGNCCLFGDSVGNGADFEGVQIVGHGRVDGAHSGETASAWVRSSYPFWYNGSSAHDERNSHGIVIPTPMDGILQSERDGEEDKCDGLAKTKNTSKTGLSEGDSDKMDFEKD